MPENLNLFIQITSHRRLNVFFSSRIASWTTKILNQCLFFQNSKRCKRKWFFLGQHCQKILIYSSSLTSRGVEMFFLGLPSPPKRKNSVFFSGKLARKYEFIYKFGQAGSPKHIRRMPISPLADGTFWKIQPLILDNLSNCLLLFY